MVALRLIPCLDVANGRVVKGVNFINLRDSGDPVELACKYSDEGADELVFLDIRATLENRNTLIDQISSNPKAVITGYKMTDGRSIGITAKFQNGEQNWFFPEEIEKG